MRRVYVDVRMLVGQYLYGCLWAENCMYVSMYTNRKWIAKPVKVVSRN